MRIKIKTTLNDIYNIEFKSIEQTNSIPKMLQVTENDRFFSVYLFPVNDIIEYKIE